MPGSHAAGLKCYKLGMIGGKYKDYLTAGDRCSAADNGSRCHVLVVCD